MAGRSRRVYFEDEIRAAETRRTRGSSQNNRGGRSRSAERVHGLFDDAEMSQGRDRGVDRDVYEQLVRENQYLRIELRDLESSRTWVDQLLRENEELKQENRELRQAGSGYVSDANDGASARKDTKLRKKVAKLEVEVDDLKSKLSESKAKATKWRKLYDDLNQAYEDVKRREKDAQRRVDIVRQNITLIEADKIRLEQENASLKTGGLDRDLEERLRRRHTKF
ncbi:hypothetical protein P885DRAFT_40099 [Corynascus similis CBS 632.67]